MVGILLGAAHLECPRGNRLRGWGGKGQCLWDRCGGRRIRAWSPSSFGRRCILWVTQEVQVEKNWSGAEGSDRQAGRCLHRCHFGWAARSLGMPCPGAVLGLETRSSGCRSEGGTAAGAVSGSWRGDPGPLTPGGVLALSPTSGSLSDDRETAVRVGGAGPPEPLGNRRSVCLLSWAQSHDQCSLGPFVKMK